MSAALAEPTRRLPLTSFSDRSLLHAVEDHADGAGWVLSADIAATLEVDRRAVASRFAWLTRFGVLERELRKGKVPRYRINAVGGSIVSARLTDAQESMISRLVNGRGVAAIGALMSREADAISANMMRREFRYHDYRRQTGG